jgi:hypothetical protein
LSLADLEMMDIGMILDYVDEYLEQSDPKKANRRKASQADFDSF